MKWPSSKLSLFLASLFISVINAQVAHQFSDLIGKDVIQNAAKSQAVTASKEADEVEKNEAIPIIEEEPRSSAIEAKTYGAKGFVGLFGGFGGRAEVGLEALLPEDPLYSPSAEGLGFADRPMSFITNFKQNDPFAVNSRVKRSRLEGLPIDLEAAASAQQFRGFAMPPPRGGQFSGGQGQGNIDPSIVAAMFQRQLMLTEEHGLPHHEAVPVQPAHPPMFQRGPPAQPHELRNMHVNTHMVNIQTPHHQVSHGTDQRGTHTTVHNQHHQIHTPEPYREPEQPYRPVVHHMPHLAHLKEAPFRGYAPPQKGGGSLEDVFRIGKYSNPQYHEPAYHEPAPAYHEPAPAYHEPAPAYHEPAPAYHEPAPAYHEPIEAVFRHAPMHHSPAPAYQKPEYHEPEPVYHAPEPAYHEPEPVYHAPEPVYHAPEPAYRPPTATYHEPIAAPAYHEPKYASPDYKDHPFSMEMIFGLPMHGHYMRKYAHMLPFNGHRPSTSYHEPKSAAYSPEPVVYHPEPSYKEPAYHPEPAYKEPAYHPEPAYKEPAYHPEPAYKEPAYHPEPAYKEPAYHPPGSYIAPQHGGSLEEVFGVATKYAHPPAAHGNPPQLYVTPRPDYRPPAYQPEVKYMEPHHPRGYGHNDYKPVYHSDYSLHYLPYEDYEPHHPETKALNRVPGIPGAAHFLTKAPHPHLRELHHSPQQYHHSIPPHPLNPHRGAGRKKRSAQE
jgi:hypothetical protein